MEPTQDEITEVVNEWKDLVQGPAGTQTPESLYPRLQSIERKLYIVWRSAAGSGHPQEPALKQLHARVLADLTEVKKMTGPAAHYKILRRMRDTNLGGMGTLQNTGGIFLGETKHAPHRRVVLKLSRWELMVDHQENPQKECEFLNKIRGTAGFVELIDTFDSRDQDPLHHWQILEFCDGDFFSFIEEQSSNRGLPGLGDQLARTYFAQLATAISKLHRMGYCHRDLKPENLLVKQNEEGQPLLKLCDFGLCTPFMYRDADGKHKARAFNSQCGTFCYLDPEAIFHPPYSGTAADVYALGVILYAMVTGGKPYSDPAPGDQLFDLIYKQGKLKEVVAHFTKLGHYPADIHPHCIDLLTRMICPANRRITMQAIFQHPWLAEVAGAAASRPSAAPTGAGDGETSSKGKKPMDESQDKDG